ncbi:ribonuclease III [bacterium]|nr:ribonuclease III [bacterium]
MEKAHLKLVKDFEKRLKYKFKAKILLKRALTHKSYANENHMPALEHNERAEFLGDAVLELSISHLLMEAFPSHPEGDLSKLRAAIVNEQQLAEVAQDIELGNYLFLGKGEDQTGGREKPSLLSDALEAVLGAIYMDRGFKKAKKVIANHFKNIIEIVGADDFIKDYKTRLQEESQGHFKAIPYYKLIREIGPDHNKTFEVNLFIKNKLYGIGQGTSKKMAEQSAAKEALEKILKRTIN